MTRYTAEEAQAFAAICRIQAGINEIRHSLWMNQRMTVERWNAMCLQIESSELDQSLIAKVNPGLVHTALQKVVAATEADECNH